MFVEFKEAGEVTEAPAKITKLSDAMRIGAALRPQCRVHLFDSGGSCALGAVYESVYGHPGSNHKIYGFADLPDSAQEIVKENIIGERLKIAFPLLRGPLHNSIYTRNDEGWSREQIADWLEAQGL